jgi:hypothetical protein
MVSSHTVGSIIEYENGELSDSETIDFFAGLIRTGVAWQLQGHYGRTAANLIRSGFISSSGVVLKYEDEE